MPLRWVLIRDPHGHFATQALLCTDLAVAPAQILAWFVQRWQLEVTFEEARRHLGLETQRQWSEVAIRRTTPALLGLFSLVTLLAHRHMPGPLGRSPAGRLVSQAPADLRRCAGAGPARDLGAPGFFHVPLRRGDRESPARRPRTLDRDALLRRLKG